MRRKFRVPAAALTVALLALIALLATLQYRWLGRISEAERERMQVTLTHRAREFAQDFDREITRAYLTFQLDPLQPEADPAQRMAQRVERWQSTGAYPGLIKDFYVVRRQDAADPTLLRYDAEAREMTAMPWPASMQDWREQFAERTETGSRGTFTVRRMAGPIWDAVPAIVVPTPLLVTSERLGMGDVRSLSSKASYVVLAIDLDYVRREMLPALAQRHFRGTGDGFDAHLAVVSAATDSAVQYQSTPAFAPKHDTPADASADLFQIRVQDFNTIAAEIRRFTAISTIHVTGESGRAPQSQTPAGGPPVSFLLQPPPPGTTERITSTLTTRPPAASGARWRLLLKHPSGSLEAAVNTARRRNLVLSMSILAVLGASMGLLVLSTRRAQELARQQMEFVAAVSHELRTPLAVIRSAGENLADGVVRDEPQIRRYGELVRSEGRRLTEMVEQILEFAGIQSGQRGLNLRAVAVAPLLHDVVDSASALISSAHLHVEMDIPDALPPVLGDEPALRRAFQNLLGNAIKYGEGGGSIVLRAHSSGAHVSVSIIDRGIGIAAG
ncbi:MAG TPA: histidine kinase dimerization/phospho-acceptor domain-containing protein, partial [Vicinamibacterales bacterium]|nr:histidine kinase dimerization/phospho-acceptor domain-containing protein [Vicinamibacterales bacterium]